MRIFTRNCLTAALALTCSLSLVACGGGGGGGGEAAVSGSETGSGGSDDNTGGNPEPPAVQDYAWETLPVSTFVTPGYGSDAYGSIFLFRGNGIVEISMAQNNLNYYGSYQYSKTGVNQAQLYLKVVNADFPDLEQQEWSLIVEFKSETSANMHGTYISNGTIRNWNDDYNIRA